MALFNKKNNTDKIQVIHHPRYGLMRRPPNEKMFFVCTDTNITPEERGRWQIIEYFIVPKEFLQLKKTRKNTMRRCIECGLSHPSTEVDHKTKTCRECMCADVVPLDINHVFPIGGHVAGYEVHR